MKTYSPLAGLFAAALLAAFLTPGCGRNRGNPQESQVFPGIFAGERLGRGTQGGTIVRADIQELDSLNPVVTRSRAVSAVLDLVFESLLSVDPRTGRIEGGIASGYRVVNDGLTILLTLNPDVRFSDGVECTAEDVLFTFEEIFMDPNVDTRKGDTLRLRDGLVTVRAVEGKTIQIDLPAPYRPFLYTLTRIPILPRHILEPLIDEGGIEAFNRQWGDVGGDTGNLIGTGPYRIDRLDPDVSLTLSKNPYYKTRGGSFSLEGMPYLDRITFLLNLDDDSKLLMFQVGKIDFYRVSDLDVASGNLDLLVANRSGGTYRLYTGGQTLETNHFLAVNQNPRVLPPDKRDIFSRTEFRRALSHLVDRDRIVKEVFGGYGYLDGSPERSASPFHTGITTRAFDPAAAKSLLDSLSLIDRDGDGFRDAPSGRPFSFSVLTNAGNPLRVAMGKIIVEELRRAGLDAQLRTEEYDAIVTRLMVTFDWDIVLLGFEGTIDPNDASWIWESSGTLHLWNPYQETPATDWERRIDDLFALGRTTWSFDGARGYYEEYQRIIHQHLPLIFLVTPPEIFGVQDGFSNLHLSSVTFNSLGIMPFVYRRRERRGIRFLTHVDEPH